MSENEHPTTILPKDFHPPSSIKNLQEVITPAGRIKASADDLFNDAIFGRDSAEAAEDLLPYKPHLAKQVIISLAELQGTKKDPLTGEEPGGIHHEHRYIIEKDADGRSLRQVAPRQREIFHRLVDKWGLTRHPEERMDLDEFTVYSTVDATPLYVRLIADYCEQEGEIFWMNSIKTKMGMSGPSARASFLVYIGSPIESRHLMLAYWSFTETIPDSSRTSIGKMDAPRLFTLTGCSLIMNNLSQRSKYKVLPMTH